MRTTLLATAVAAALLVAGVASPAEAVAGSTHGGGHSFALIGDTPYGDAQQAAFPALVQDIDEDPDVRFVLHAGDVKNGSTTCDDARFATLAGLFGTFDDPFVLTPGDNEWTDCHRTAAGGYLPTERLAAVRRVFYPVAGRTLGETTMRVDSQARDRRHRAYRENVLFTRDRIVYATVHVVGSENGLAPWSQLPGGDRPAERLAEFEARKSAALDWIDRAFDLARHTRAPGVLLMMQAEPADTPGFADIRARVVERSKQYGKPVLLTHGDEHVYEVEPGYAGVPNLTRLETYGDTATNWLKVTADARKPGVFSWEPRTVKPSLDLQAHRGGIGLVVESTPAAFANALELGVSTLELDVQITEDGQAVVTHDRRISNRKCRDTAPAFDGDPEYPYVGKFINTLTLRQVRTMDCGSLTLPEFPGQRAVPGAKMALLREVFALVKHYRARDVTLNVETKVEAGAPHETAPREQFVQVTAAEVRRARLTGQVTIQSFDWGALMRMRQVEPRLPIVALTNRDFLQTGRPGASPWLGGIDIDDFGGDPLKAVKSFGADAFSPVHGFPQNGKITDPGYQPYVTKAMVDQAHALGLKVIPWTIDDQPTMGKLIDDGVDGIITDYPDRLRALMADRGFKLPPQYTPRP